MTKPFLLCAGSRGCKGNRCRPPAKMSVTRIARYGHFASGMPFLIQSALLTPSGGLTQAAG
jgi:hypothetical protein